MSEAFGETDDIFIWGFLVWWANDFWCIGGEAWWVHGVVCWVPCVGVEALDLGIAVGGK